jgi:hypothetical protein
LCEDITESEPVFGTVQLILLIFGIVLILGGTGYIVYKTFIETQSQKNNKISSNNYNTNNYNKEMPISKTNKPIILTPEQRATMEKQRENILKKQQSRIKDRKNILKNLEDDNLENDINKSEAVILPVAKVDKKIGNKKEVIKPKKTNADGYVEFKDIDDTNVASENKKETFEKLKKIGNKESSTKKEISKNSKVENKDENVEDKTLELAKKISEISNSDTKNIAPTLKKYGELSDFEAIKMFGTMDRDTIMSGAFSEVLSDLLSEGKITKENVSNILFEYMDKGVLTKGDVAKISSEIKII